MQLSIRVTSIDIYYTKIDSPYQELSIYLFAKAINSCYLNSIYCFGMGITTYRLPSWYGLPSSGKSAWSETTNPQEAPPPGGKSLFRRDRPDANPRLFV
ncbi:hypothetical protein OUZ56_026136 [Daphnia magna]|uniref:Uncharacterized protein n=1 Tax=Daphnia magna TaxID=35525 RepID=A0ABQ9ZLC6_9CRUS|nr:hypothetical protein OUZ56_026136 [Daphnia magna]